jgi:hypothetical protein
MTSMMGRSRGVRSAVEPHPLLSSLLGLVRDWLLPRPSVRRLLQQNLPEADTARSIILRASAPELSNNIIQKGLAFIDHWSGTVVRYGPHECPGILPRRLVGRGGASVVRRNAAINRMEDSDAKVCKEAFA